jgi:phosphoribosylformylglycinamidine synthase
MGGSHYELVSGGAVSGGVVPQVDLNQAPEIFQKLHDAIQAGVVRSCHDLSEGGLAVALAEMAFAGGLGADITGLADLKLPDEVALFSESPTRFVLEVVPDKVNQLLDLFGTLPVKKLGSVCKEPRLRIAGGNGEWIIWAALDSLKEAWQKPLRW